MSFEIFFSSAFFTEHLRITVSHIIFILFSGICGRFGTVCQNVSIDESGLEGKSTVVEDTKGTLQVRHGSFVGIAEE